MWNIFDIFVVYIYCNIKLLKFYKMEKQINDLTQKLNDAYFVFIEDKKREIQDKIEKKYNEKMAICKKKAEDVMNSLTEEKLLPLAQNGLTKYLLFYIGKSGIPKGRKIHEDDTIEKCICILLTEMLEESGFNVRQFKINYNELTKYSVNADGYYLGISWE